MKKLFAGAVMVMLMISGTFVMGEKYDVGTQVMTDAGTMMTIKAPNHYLPDSRSTSITTFYNSNNGGSFGGGFYFDLSVGPKGLAISAFDINAIESGAMTLSVYILEGTCFGNEENPGAWGPAVATGTGTCAGFNIPSHMDLDVPVALAPNTNYGVALILDASHSHRYTNGNGTNQFFSNDDISLTFGSATNSPFSGGVNIPRVLNGTIYYDITSEIPISNWALGIGIVLILAFSLIRLRRLS